MSIDIARTLTLASVLSQEGALTYGSLALGEEYPKIIPGIMLAETAKGSNALDDTDSLEQFLETHAPDTSYLKIWRMRKNGVTAMRAPAYSYTEARKIKLVSLYDPSVQELASRFSVNHALFQEYQEFYRRLSMAWQEVEGYEYDNLSISVSILDRDHQDQYDVLINRFISAVKDACCNNIDATVSFFLRHCGQYDPRQSQLNSLELQFLAMGGLKKQKVEAKLETVAVFDTIFLFMFAKEQLKFAPW